MKALLDKLSTEMNRVNPRGFARFNQGISQEEINKKLKGFPISASDFNEVLELLKWRNGGLTCSGDGLEVVFIPGYMLLNLDEIITHYEQFNDFPEVSGKYWIPFLNDFSDGFYYYDIRDKSIIHLITQVPEGERYKSMMDFLTVVYTCYRDNIYFLDQSNYLESDFKNEGAIVSSYSETFILGDEEIGL
ncbi:MAG: hypothetical protein CV087_11265 [Candidatus Brocadia sp. WS118]|nr:MAG: hypothetical protein CV087_11265 [Candidatus Brocadia sp. WS118]